MKIHGYTLIEILVALTVFSILATATSYTLYNAFQTKKLVNKQANQLSELQLAVSILERDVKQIINRSSYGNNMHFYSPFIGNNTYVEFTRNGVSNINYKQRNSNLRRIAYLCKNQKLIRRQWERVDTPNRNDYNDRILLTNLTDCSFDFLSQSLQILSNWKAADIQANQQKSILPIAIQFNFTTADWGNLNLIFSIPTSAYAIIQKS